MFTGIVEELGEVVGVTDLPDESRRLVISGPLVTSDARHGDSIAVNGVCLTVVELDNGSFAADVMRETLVRSSLGQAAPGTRVNLERPVTLATRLGGHLVQGHVDGTATVASREPSANWDLVRFAVDPALGRYIVAKGSITVDGVSLTVVDVAHDGGWFTVSLIPATLAATTLGFRAVGDIVNIEVDVLAKYVERLTSFGAQS